MPYTFAIVDETKRWTASQLFPLLEPLEANAQDCAKAWGLRAPSVEIVDRVTELRSYMVPVVITDNTRKGALAVHSFNPVRDMPAARAYAPKATGLTTGKHSLLESLGHEILEASVNPQLNRWTQWPSKLDGVEVPLECADMTQDTYPFQAGNGRIYQVANFVTPAWFDTRLLDHAARAKFLEAGGKFDHAGRMRVPGEVLRSGYTIYREQVGGYWRKRSVWGEDANRERAVEASRHEFARCHALGCDLGLMATEERERL